MLACDLSYDYFLFGCYCISTPLYIIVLWVLARVPSSDKILCTPFFRIVISTGILDNIVASLNYFFTKFRLWGWAFDFYAEIDPFPRFMECAVYWATLAQSTGTILIALNRYTALALPYRHQEIWSAKRVRLCIAAQWLIPAAITIPGAIFGLEDYNLYLVPDNGIVNGINYTGLTPFPVISSPKNELGAWMSTLFQELVIMFWMVGSVIVLFIYLRLFCAMRNIVQNNQRGRTQQQQQQSAAAFSREIRLLFYGIAIVLIQGLGATFSTFIIIFGFQWYRPLETASDYNCYIHPYFLLLLSTALRERFLSFLRVRKTQRSINVQSQGRSTARIVAITSAAPIVA